jgi:hypothetical protein
MVDAIAPGKIGETMNFGKLDFPMGLGGLGDIAGSSPEGRSVEFKSGF